MLSEKELLYTLALVRIKNLGDSTIKKLITTVGSAEGVFKEKKHHLLKIEGIGNFKLKELNNSPDLTAAQNELEYINRNNLKTYYFLDDQYPNKLKHCLDGPILLFEKGKSDFNSLKLISIVGTRQVTSHGKAICEEIINDLMPYNPIIVSGYAYGVDICAHKAAMDRNLQTIACLAHGFSEIYPKKHRIYNRQIESNGSFLTEFWSDSKFERTNFLRRNRVIAGLSAATLVIESGAKGGSLVTADIANSYNREVFAVPGRTTDSQSIGCNNLIKSQQAHLIQNAADIVYHLGWNEPQIGQKSIQKQLFVELSQHEKIVHDFLNKQNIESLDDISLGCGLPTAIVAATLLSLELKGLVRPLPGKMFETI